MSRYRGAVPLGALVLVLTAAAVATGLGIDESPASRQAPASTPLSAEAIPGLPPPIPNGIKVVGEQLSFVEREARAHHLTIYSALRLPTPAPAGTVVSAGPNYPYELQLEVSTGPDRETNAVLPGASGPPARMECDQALGMAEDGNNAPLFCADGAINIAAWDYFVGVSGLPLMGLPKSTSTCTIASRIPLVTATGPIGASVVELATAYYGWSFPFGLAENIIWQMPNPNPCSPTTAVIDVSPVGVDGSLASPYNAEVDQGSCITGGAVATGAAYTCNVNGRRMEACWGGRTRSGKPAAYCFTDAWQGVIVEVQVKRLPTARLTSTSLPLELAVSAFGRCQLVSLESAEYTCGWGPKPDALVGRLDQSASQWKVRVLQLEPASAFPELSVGSDVSVTGAWFGAAVNSSPSSDHLPSQ